MGELSRKLGVQEAELKRAVKSAEKALEREEKLVEKIYNLQSKYKTTEARFEYGEMNITKLNHRIDDIEVEIYREKLKIKVFRRAGRHLRRHDRQLLNCQTQMPCD